MSINTAKKINVPSSYHVGLDSVISASSFQQKVHDVLKNGGGNVDIPTINEIIEIGNPILDRSNVLGSGWSKEENMTPDDILQLHNIHDKNNELTSLISSLLAKSTINKSENPINLFSEEHEFKILDVDFDDLTNRLKGEGFEPLYNARIYDVYNDFKNKSDRLDKFKGINRNRYKVGNNEPDKDTYSRLLTLKRKLKEGEGDAMIGNIPARKAYELEYQINEESFTSFIQYQDAMGFKPMRQKVKNRWAFIKYFPNNIVLKAEIDEYNGIYIMEVEVSKSDGTIFGQDQNDIKVLTKLLRKLGLSTKAMVSRGSRRLFKEYDIKYTNFFK